MRVMKMIRCGERRMPGELSTAGSNIEKEVRKMNDRQMESVLQTTLRILNISWSMSGKTNLSSSGMAPGSHIAHMNRIRGNARVKTLQAYMYPDFSPITKLSGGTCWTMRW